MSFGVVQTGFNRPALAELVADLEDLFRGTFGSNLSLEPDTPQAQLIGSIAGMLDTAWQASEDLYNANRPSSSSGVPLTQLGALIGIVRREETFTQVQGLLAGPVGTPVLTSYEFRSTSGDIYRPIVATEIPSGGIATVTMQADAPGPLSVGVGELTEIVTAGTGITTVGNVFPSNGQGGQTGTFGETDEQFRARYAASTELAASNVLDGLYSALLALDGVSRLRIYVNATNGVVGSRPAHSYETVIEGGDVAQIAETIWSRHPAGIALHGSSTENIEDSQGQTQAIGYTRPTAVPITVAITTNTTSEFPSTGAEDIKAAVVAFGGAHFGIGDDVNIARLYTPANQTPGHVITAITINGGAGDVAIGETEVSQFTVANVTVNGA